MAEFYVFSEVVGVFAGLMSASVRMHRERASRSRFVKDVVSWLRWSVGCQSGQGSREAFRARSLAFRFIAPDVDSEISGSGEDEVSLSQKELPEVRGSVCTPLGGD